MRPLPHRELCDFVDTREDEKKLILLPRGAFKSSVVTIGYSLFRLINNPNLRILISSETFGQSKIFLRGIKNHIESNDIFKMIFGELKPKGSESIWRQEELTIATREDATNREPSVSCSGVGITKVGMHYDLVILDDVVSDKNINTPEQINKIINHYKLLLSILDPGAELIIIGTRYSFADLYGHILDQDDSDFKTLVRAAYNREGRLYFPSRLTKKYLERQRRAQGTLHFSNQYLNNPVDQDSATFKRKWIRYYKSPPKGLRKFMAVDPAASLSRNADFTGIIIAGMDWDSNIYVLETIEVKKTIKEVLDIIFDRARQYKINEDGCVGIEMNAFQQTLKYMITEEMNTRNFYFAVNELKPDTRVSKERRIMSLQPFFENGKILYREEMTELYDQTIMFPRTKHDDLIDALASILKIAVPADKPKKGKWEGSTLPDRDKQVWDDTHERIKQVEKRSVRRTKWKI